MLDRVKFVSLMTGFCELYNKVPSQFLYDIYYEVLKDYSYEQVNKAFMDCIRVYKYNLLPKPAEILEFLEGTRDDKALMAWLQVMEAVQKGGYYASIEFADPIIAHCVQELGGWQWLCCIERKELPFIEKRFMDLYRLFMKRGVQNNIRLIGFIEARNNQLGHFEEIPKPVKIGFMELQGVLTNAS